MSTNRRLPISIFALGLLAACDRQEMARVVPADVGPAPTADGPPVTGAPTPTALGDQLRAAGLDVASLPALDAVDDDHIIDVMKTFTAALGAKCSDCHAADKHTVTPKMRVAKKMWSDFVQQLSLADGEPLYCDSCHQGKATFLDRSDDDALGKWMASAFVKDLQRKDGSKQSCSSCHGTPFDGSFLDGWAAAGDDAVVDGGAPTDAGTTPPDLGPAPDLSPPGSCDVVLNEVQTAGSAGAGDEFIELYNPCAAAVALDDATLVYRSAAGSTDTTLVALGARSLAAGAYLVVASTVHGDRDDVRYAGGLAAAGGGVALRRPSGLVDRVAWGTATNAFVEGSPAPAPPSGMSIARTPNGSHAAHDQSRDLVVATPTPGAAN